MRITSVEVQAVGNGMGVTALLLLGTDQGLVGIGELPVNGAPMTARAAQDLTSTLLGRDPFDVQALTIEYHARRDRGSPDVAALAAASTAMADLCGQYLGVPAHQLLGGRVRDQVHVCAIGWDGATSDLEQLEAAARRTVDAGFKALSVAGAGTADEVAASIGALRESLSADVDLVVGAGRELATDDARALGDRIARFEPLWLECHVEIAWRQRAAGEPRFKVPVASSSTTSPSALGQLVTSGRVDHIVLDVGQVGGLHEARRIAAFAEVYHVGIIPRGSTPVSLAMALHLAAVIPNLTMVQMAAGLLPVRGGMVDVDLTAGLGLDRVRATTLEVA